MRLAYYDFDEAFEFEENSIVSLIIENQNAFMEFARDISAQTEGLEGKAVLSEDNKIIEFAKHCEIIFNFAPFEINRKTLLSKVVADIEKKGVRENYYEKTQKILSEIENHILNIALDYNCEFSFEKLNFSSIVKAAGIKIEESGYSTLEKIIEYMELVLNFEKTFLFVFVNMRSYFCEDDMNDFFDTVINHKINALFLENREYKRYQNEKRMIIDADLCKI